MSYYYKLEQEPTSVYITDEPREIPGTIEITEEDYQKLLAQRAERDISEDTQYMMPRSAISED